VTWEEFAEFQARADGIFGNGRAGGGGEGLSEVRGEFLLIDGDGDGKIGAEDFVEAMDRLVPEP